MKQILSPPVITRAAAAAPRSRSRKSAPGWCPAPGSTQDWGLSTRYPRAEGFLIIAYFHFLLQILAGPAFVAVFSVSGVFISVLSDKLKASVSRVILVGSGATVFSAGVKFRTFLQKL